MGTEKAVQQFWLASMAWRGREEAPASYTTQGFFRTLKPLYEYPSLHRSHRLVDQAWELSEMIVSWKRQRRRKPRKALQNVIQFPIKHKPQTKVA